MAGFAIGSSMTFPVNHWKSDQIKSSSQCLPKTIATETTMFGNTLYQVYLFYATLPSLFYIIVIFISHIVIINV